MLIVAQRISTIMNAEQIIVLNDGRIAGIGTHQELLENCEVYQQIAASQLSESELKSGKEGKAANNVGGSERRCRSMPRGMHGHGNAAGERAKDFKGTIKKLIRYMSAFKVHMLFVAVFAICGTVFNIVGPRILGKATTEIFNGL